MFEWGGGLILFQEWKVPLQRGLIGEGKKSFTMPANLIMYDVLRAGPEISEIKSRLNDHGRRGFQVVHTSKDEKGIYTFICSKDTGRAAEEDDNQVGGDWIDDGFVNEETSWT